MNNSVQENIAGIRVVKSYVREEYEQDKFERSSASVKDDFTKVEKILALNNPAMMFSIFSAMLLISFFGAKMIIASHGSSLTTGQLSSLISYGVQILSAMMMLSMIFVMTTMADESAQRINEVLLCEPSLGNSQKSLKTVADGSIEFKNVSFRYSQNAKRNALNNISLKIKSGETIGILGSTGSSKTTLIQLIPRLYDACEGTVYVGSEDVKNYDLQTLRDNVAVVLQKNVLFSGTVNDNLKWGNKNADDDEIKKACVTAQADEFIQTLPKKYDTYIERGGVNISGGQKQRLCIARALLKKPKILILDDSTSAVDTKTDSLIRKSLKEDLPQTTKIIISQRVSSVEDADNILLLDGGEIKEYGSPAYLMSVNSIYREIYEAQTKGRDE
jgi:ATP-binding cassette subfamily B protein